MSVKQGLYRLVLAVSRPLGLWVVALVAWFIASGYFLFRPARVRHSVRFYRALFPARGLLHALACTWRQYHSFSANYADRLRLQGHGELHYETEGFEAMIAAAEGRGAVLVMSHLGHWEIAARLLRRKGARLLIYVSSDRRAQLDKLLKSEMAADGVQVVAVEPGQQSGLTGLEGLAFLRGGGLVSLAGDRVATAGARRVAVRFLGRRLELPAAPYVMAMVAGAPLFFFFAVRLGRGRYRIVASEAHQVCPKDRADRKAAIARAAQFYADHLAEACRAYPEQWYTFEPFLPEAGGREGDSPGAAPPQ